MLTDMIRQFKDFSTLDQTNQELLLRLADAFEQDTENLFRSPDELQVNLNIGSKQRWKEFLKLPPVQNFIDQEVKEVTKVNFRKGLKAIADSATQGDNAQFSKQLTEISGFLERQDNQKIIVLHRISRPEFETLNT